MSDDEHDSAAIERTIAAANEAFRLAGLEPLYPELTSEQSAETLRLIHKGRTLDAQKFLLAAIHGAGGSDA